MARGGLTRSREGREGFFGGGGARRGSHGDAEARRVCLHRETTTWPNGTARGSVVLVLSAAVLVIVIDERAGGMRLARVGGSRKGAKLAKWLGARGIYHEGTKFTKGFLNFEF